jgi:DnaJ-class molecular chaperone
VSADHELFGLPETATAMDVKLKYRELAHTFHPDKGGDPARFTEVHEAYSRLITKLSKPSSKRPCANCKGKRKVSQARGFSVIKVPCPECKEHR